MYKAAKHYDIPYNLAHRLITQESGWNPNAKSYVGATGLAQLMPTTAKALSVDATDPVENIIGGMRYLKQMYDRFQSWKLAVAAYNSGATPVVRYRGVPPYKETQHYVKVICKNDC